MTAQRRALRGWFELIRPPNLPTVPGDPLAGFFLAGVALGGPISLMRAWPAVVSSLLLYAAGLILNDIADYSEDLADRPDRPLPSGRVSKRAALGLAGLLSLIAMGVAVVAGVAPLVVTGGLLALILSYNFILRRWPLVGIINMGLCRGVSLLLGASILGHNAMMTPLVLCAAAALTLYIVALSCVALGETRQQRIGIRAWLPMGAMLVLLAGTYVLRFNVPFLAMVTGAAAILQSVVTGISLRGRPEQKRVGAQIGALIRALLLVQATWCALAGGVGTIVALCLIALWPVAYIVGRSFYAS